MTDTIRSYAINSNRAAGDELQRLLWHTAYKLLAPQDVWYQVVTQWLACSPSRLEKAMRQAKKHDVPVCIIISSTSEPDVYTPKPLAYTSCPLGERIYRSEVFQDQRFWLFRGELYREGDPGLCRFCEHQLRCAVEGKPLDAFKNAHPRPAPKPTKRSKP